MVRSNEPPAPKARLRVAGVLPELGYERCAACGQRVIPASTMPGRALVRRLFVDPQTSSVGNVVLCFYVDGLGLPVGRQLAVPAPDDHVGPRWLLHGAVCPKASPLVRGDAWRGIRS